MNIKELIEETIKTKLLDKYILVHQWEYQYGDDAIKSGYDIITQDYIEGSDIFDKDFLVKNFQTKIVEVDVNWVDNRNGYGWDINSMFINVTIKDNNNVIKCRIEFYDTLITDINFLKK
jgi:hypothetical protein